MLNELWAKAGVRHRAEQRRLDLLVNDFTFKFSVEDNSSHFAILKVDSVPQRHFVASVAEPTKTADV